METREWFSYLEKYTARECDRFGCLYNWLAESNLTKFKVKVIDLKESCFLQVSPLEEAKSLVYKKIFVAHYDRRPESPAANDNSAAVIQLFLFLKGLQAKKNPPWLEVIFTDKEEITPNASLQKQGSFIFGEYLKNQAEQKLLSFHFDMCGRGDTVILSTAAEGLLKRRQKKESSIYQQLQRLKTIVLDSLRWQFRGRIMLLLTPFSDNLGFLLQGIPSLHFCLLPFKEAYTYQRAYQALIKELSLRSHIDPEAKEVFKRRFQEIQPETWKLRHTPGDDLASLSPESLKVMEGLFEALVRIRLSKL